MGTTNDLPVELNDDVVNKAFNIARSSRQGVLSVVNMGPEAGVYERYKTDWMNQRVDADASVSAAGALIGATTVDVADGSIFKENMPVSYGGDEVVLVTGIAGNTLTIARAFGGTTAAAIPAGATLTIDSRGRKENSLAETDQHKYATRGFNHFQVFDAAINFSRREAASSIFGGQNSVAEQLGFRLEQMAIQMDRALIRGRRAVAGAGDDAVSFAGGFGFYTDEADSIKIDAAAAALSLDLINDVNQEIITRGGKSDTIAVSITKARQIQALLNAKYGSQRLSEWVMDEGSALMLPSDIPLVGTVNRIVVDTNINDDELYIFDSGSVSIRPMTSGNANRSGNWSTEDATTKGQDGQTMRLLGDFSFELMNYETNLARLHNIA